MGFISPQELWQQTVLKRFMTDIVHSSWDIPFLDKEKVINGFDNYMQGNKDNWTFWWRIFCYIYWLKKTSEK